MKRLSRRDFMKPTAFSAAAFSISSSGVSANQIGLGIIRGAVKRVIVIGAGLAGLSAAFELTGYMQGALESGIRAAREIERAP